MTLSELLYAFAFVIYMTAAACSFRYDGPATARWAMGSAVLLDFLLSVLPRFGVEALSMHLGGSNQMIVSGVMLGVAVWLLFLMTLLIHKAGKYRLYHAGVLLVELLWFIDFLLFLYGVYKFPLH